MDGLVVATKVPSIDAHRFQLLVDHEVTFKLAGSKPRRNATSPGYGVSDAQFQGFGGIPYQPSSVCLPLGVSLLAHSKTEVQTYTSHHHWRHQDYERFSVQQKLIAA